MIKKPSTPFIVFFAVLTLSSLVMFIAESLAFFKTWGFVAPDMVFIAIAFILFLYCVGIKMINTRKLPRSLEMGVVILLIAWVLADWVIFPKNTRISDLIDALWLLIVTGVFMGWLYTFWKQIRNAVTEEPQHNSIDIQ